MHPWHLPVVNGPSGMKNAPTVMAVAAANLKNQNLQGEERPMLPQQTSSHAIDYCLRNKQPLILFIN